MTIDKLELLLLIAALVAMVARRLRLPYTVGLVSAGIALAAASIQPDLPLTKHILFALFLPPLVFEAAINIPWPELRKNLLVVVTLATLGVVVSGGATAAGMHWIARWDWSSALLFGALIAATDPVSVIATIREAGATGRLRLLLESDSLFNDGTAAVAFGLVLSVVQGHATGVGPIAGDLVRTVVGGIACGALIGGAALVLAGRSDDHLVEITLSTVAAFGSFALADHFGLSGVLSTLTAGLLIGNASGFGAISERGREALDSFWEYLAFASNSLVFLLIGMRVAQQHFGPVLVPCAVAIVVVLVGRALSVYGCCALFSRSRNRVAYGHQHVLVWGGLRGALALALALGIPPEVPNSGEIRTVTFAVVAFSVLVQGLTVRRMLHAVGEPMGADPAT